METTNFKKEGFWYFLYRLNYKTELPPDTCTYKRGLIVSILTGFILLPLTILRISYRLIIKTSFIKEKTNWEPIYGLVGYLPPFGVIMLPLLFGSAILGEEQKNFLIIWISGFLLIVLICIIIGAIIYLVVYLMEKHKEVKIKRRQKIRELGNDPDKNTAFENLYESWKEKLCKKIEWEDNDDEY